MHILVPLDENDSDSETEGRVPFDENDSDSDASSDTTNGNLYAVALGTYCKDKLLQH